MFINNKIIKFIQQFIIFLKLPKLEIEDDDDTLLILSSSTTSMVL